MDKSPHKLEHEGRPYYFCSAKCQGKFAANPLSYLAPKPPADTLPAAAGTIYTCPMRPEIRQDHPGNCPKCGMTLAVSDPVKASTPEALATLKASGLRIVMATGDGLTTARAVAARLGIDEVHGEVKPVKQAGLTTLSSFQAVRFSGAVVALIHPRAPVRPDEQHVIRVLASAVNRSIHAR